MLMSMSTYHGGQLVNILISEEYPGRAGNFMKCKVDQEQLKKYFKTKDVFQTVQNMLKDEPRRTLKTYFTDRCQSSDYIKTLPSRPEVIIEIDNAYNPY